MSKSDQIRAWLEENKDKNQCRQAWKDFMKDTGIELHYSQFHGVFKMFAVVNDITVVSASRNAEDRSDTEEKMFYGTLKHDVWKALQTKELADKFSIGKQAQIAGDNDLYTIQKYHIKGEPCWPDADGVTLRSTNPKHMNERYVYVESVKVVA